MLARLPKDSERGRGRVGSRCGSGAVLVVVASFGMDGEWKPEAEDGEREWDAGKVADVGLGKKEENMRG